MTLCFPDAALFHGVYCGFFLAVFSWPSCTSHCTLKIQVMLISMFLISIVIFNALLTPSCQLYLFSGFYDYLQYFFHGHWFSFLIVMITLLFIYSFILWNFEWHSIFLQVLCLAMLCLSVLHDSFTGSLHLISDCEWVYHCMFPSVASCQCSMLRSHGKSPRLLLPTFIFL